MFYVDVLETFSCCIIIDEGGRGRASATHIYGTRYTSFRISTYVYTTILADTETYIISWYMSFESLHERLVGERK